MVQTGRTPEEAEKLMYEEIARLQEEGITPKELLRARTAARRSAVSVRSSVLSRASSLASDAVRFNDPGRLNTIEQRRAAVTAEQVREAARKYLRPENRTVVVTVPAASPPGATKPAAAKKN
jgi:zinc protease